MPSPHPHSYSTLPAAPRHRALQCVSAIPRPRCNRVQRAENDLWDPVEHFCHASAYSGRSALIANCLMSPLYLHSSSSCLEGGENSFILEPNTMNMARSTDLGCPHRYCEPRCCQLHEVFISTKPKALISQDISNTLVATAGKWSQSRWETSVVGLRHYLATFLAVGLVEGSGL